MTQHKNLWSLSSYVIECIDNLTSLLLSLSTGVFVDVVWWVGDKNNNDIPIE